jgi:uncharacterized protein (TIGR02118 family)
MPVMRFGLAPRLASLDIAAFQEHWHDEHGPLVAKFMGVRRVWQNHALLRDGMPILPWPGFDACAELEFDDLAAAKFAFSAAHYPPELREHTGKLVDMQKNAVIFAERRLLTGSIDLRDVRLLTFLRRAPGRFQRELDDGLRALPAAAAARAREVFVAVEDADAANGFDAIDSQWFESAHQAEQYVTSAEAAAHRHATAHLVRGVERLLARVRVIR